MIYPFLKKLWCVEALEKLSLIPVSLTRCSRTQHMIMKFSMKTSCSALPVGVFDVFPSSHNAFPRALFSTGHSMLKNTFVVPTASNHSFSPTSLSPIKHFIPTSPPTPSYSRRFSSSTANQPSPLKIPEYLKFVKKTISFPDGLKKKVNIVIYPFSSLAKPHTHLNEALPLFPGGGEEAALVVKLLDPDFVFLEVTSARLQRIRKQVFNESRVFKQQSSSASRVLWGGLDEGVEGGVFSASAENGLGWKRGVDNNIFRRLKVQMELLGCGTSATELLPLIELEAERIEGGSGNLLVFPLDVEVRRLLRLKEGVKMGTEGSYKKRAVKEEGISLGGGGLERGASGVGGDEGVASAAGGSCGSVSTGSSTPSSCTASSASIPSSSTFLSSMDERLKVGFSITRLPRLFFDYPTALRLHLRFVFKYLLGGIPQIRVNELSFSAYLEKLRRDFRDSSPKVYQIVVDDRVSELGKEILSYIWAAKQSGGEDEQDTHSVRTVASSYSSMMGEEGGGLGVFRSSKLSPFTTTNVDAPLSVDAPNTTLSVHTPNDSDVLTCFIGCNAMCAAALEDYLTTWGNVAQSPLSAALAAPPSSSLYFEKEDVRSLQQKKIFALSFAYLALVFRYLMIPCLLLWGCVKLMKAIWLWVDSSLSRGELISDESEYTERQILSLLEKDEGGVKGADEGRVSVGGRMWGVLKAALSGKECRETDEKSVKSPVF